MGSTNARASFSRELSSVRRRKAIGASLKARRERRRWTLQHVADKADFSLGKLWRIENGESRVRLEDLVVLGAILRVPLAKLISLDAPEKLPAVAAAAQKKKPAKKKAAPKKKAPKKPAKAPEKKKPAKRASELRRVLNAAKRGVEPDPVPEMPEPTFSADFETPGEPERVEPIEQPEPRPEIGDLEVGDDGDFSETDVTAPEALPPEAVEPPPPADDDDVDARAAS